MKNFSPVKPTFRGDLPVSRRHSWKRSDSEPSRLCAVSIRHVPDRVPEIFATFLAKPGMCRCAGFFGGWPGMVSSSLFALAPANSIRTDPK